LADEAAVNSVALARGKTGRASRINIQLEDYRDAKGLFYRMLSQAKLPAAPVVYQEIARAADVANIAARCPRFRNFVDKVHSC
jgi:hypothetical protein